MVSRVLCAHTLFAPLAFERLFNGQSCLTQLCDEIKGGRAFEIGRQVI